MGPRCTVSIQSVARSTPGAAGFSRETPTPIRTTTTSAVAPYPIWRVRLRFRLSGRAMSISGIRTQGQIRWPTDPRMHISILLRHRRARKRAIPYGFESDIGVRRTSPPTGSPGGLSNPRIRLQADPICMKISPTHPTAPDTGQRAKESGRRRCTTARDSSAWFITTADIAAAPIRCPSSDSVAAIPAKAARSTATPAQSPPRTPRRHMRRPAPAAS